MKKFFNKFFNWANQKKSKKRIESRKKKPESVMYDKDEQLSFSPKRTRFSLFKSSLEFKRFQSDNEKYYIKYYFIFGSILIFLILYFVIFSSYFAVQKIYVYRQDNISNINITYKALNDMYLQSLLLLNKRDIAMRVKKYQKNVKTVSVRKLFPNSLKVTIGSFPALFNTRLADREYQIVENGVLVPMKYDKELPSIRVHLQDEDSLWMIDYKKILDESYLKKAYLIYDNFRHVFLTVKMLHLEYYPKEREIHIMINNDTKILFDLMGGINDQLEKIYIFHNKYFNLLKPWIVYIDLRPKWKIFYCVKDDRRTCTRNLTRIYGEKNKFDL